MNHIVGEGKAEGFALFGLEVGKHLAVNGPVALKGGQRLFRSAVGCGQLVEFALDPANMPLLVLGHFVEDVQGLRIDIRPLGMCDIAPLRPLFHDNREGKQVNQALGIPTDRPIRV